jgi:hypothetical protein
MVKKLVITEALFFASGFTLSADTIIVRPMHAKNRGLVAHECVHAERIAEVGALKWRLKYFFSRAFRLDEEARAYAVHSQINGALDSYATYLRSDYMLGISQEKAVAAILAWMPWALTRRADFLAQADALIAASAA